MFRHPDFQLKKKVNPFEAMRKKVKGFVDKLFTKKPKITRGEFQSKDQHVTSKRMGFSDNHGAGESKKRKKMADRSRRINRGGSKRL